MGRKFDEQLNDPDNDCGGVLGLTRRLRSYPVNYRLSVVFGVAKNVARQHNGVDCCKAKQQVEKLQGYYRLLASPETKLTDALGAELINYLIDCLINCGWKDTLTAIRTLNYTIHSFAIRDGWEGWSPPLWPDNWGVNDRGLSTWKLTGNYPKVAFEVSWVVL